MMSNDSKWGSRGPCVGCGEPNHTAHKVSICAGCVGVLRVCRCHQLGCTRTPELCSKHAIAETCVLSECNNAARICLSHRDAQVADAVGTARTEHLVNVSFTPFEAAMVLCVLAVAKGGSSQFDTPEVPIRRQALEQAYKRLSGEMGVPAASEESL